MSDVTAPADPEKLSAERLAELRRDYPRVPANVRADTSIVRREMNEVLDALACQAAEIAELKAKLHACAAFWTEVSPIPFEEEMAFLMGVGPDPHPTAKENVRLRAQLAAAEAERDNLTKAIAYAGMLIKKRDDGTTYITLPPMRPSP